MIDLFWRRWIREYVRSLQSRSKWLKEDPNLKVGDLVLMVDEHVHRGLWPIGRVVSVNRGRDGLVRSVCLKTKSSQVTRPITKLVTLECD